VALVIDQSSRIQPLSLLIFAVTLMFTATLGLAWPNFAQEYQVLGHLVGRTGPGEDYPVAAELRGSTRASKVAEEGNGWVALRLDDGRVVWVTAEDLRSDAALLASIPPLRPSLTAAVTATETNGKKPVQTGAPLSSTGGDQIPQTGGPSAAPQSVIDANWRPVSAGASKMGVSPPTAFESKTLPQTQQVSRADPPTSPAAQNPDDLLDQAELELSTILTKDPTQWRFDSIQDKVASLAASRLTPAQIARMDALAAKLATARQIADLSLKAHAYSQPMPGPVVLPYSAAGQPPGSPVRHPTGNLGTSPPGTFSTNALTVVPPPSTRITPESRMAGTRGNTVAIATNQPSVFPPSTPSDLGGIGTTAVFPASFEAPSTGELPQSATPSRPAEMSPEAAPGTSRPGPGLSLREEIARELNELRRERFDAVGRLVKAQVRRPSDPPYLVVDESGAIVCYVKPAPGTLLRTYVGHWVGISGHKARLPDGRGLLITAESLRLLDPP